MAILSRVHTAPNYHYTVNFQTKSVDDSKKLLVCRVYGDRATHNLMVKKFDKILRKDFVVPEPLGKRLYNE